MRRSLTFKLTLAFIIVGLVGVALMAIFIGLYNLNEFNQFIYEDALGRFSNDITTYYTAQGTLQGFAEAMKQRGNPPPKAGAPSEDANGQTLLPPGGRGGLVRFGLADPTGQVVLRAESAYAIGEMVPAEALASAHPVELNGQVIAIILPPVNPLPYSPLEQSYINRTTQALTFAVTTATLAAVVLGIVLARTISRPMRELMVASQRVAKGEFGHEVSIQSQDEIGKLAQAFNQMSAALARADHVRRQMTADIAHELRNPLTVISGYIDMMQGGYVAITPERFETIQKEAQHLNRLVDDLRTLSLADVGALALRPESISVHDLLQHVTSTYKDLAEQQKVELIAEAETELPEIEVDVGRMSQVLGNLVSNALRYTPTGGQVRLAARANAEAVILKVKDTGSGIGPDDLPFIFERFYRTDKSRHEHRGGSGLGLAIAKAIVEAHHGSIWAESELGNGTQFNIRLGMA